MTDGIIQRLRSLGLLLLLAGCVPSVDRPAAEQRPPSYSTAGLESVMGHDARDLVAAFGAADLDVREGSARKLQFRSPACVLDAYLYPQRGGGEPVVTHIDTRLPDGRDVDRASCVAAMSRREEAR